MTAPATAVTVHDYVIDGNLRVSMVDAHRAVPIALLHVDVALSIGVELVLCAQRAKRNTDLDRILDSYKTGQREAVEDCVALVASVREGRHDLDWLEQRLSEIPREAEDDPR